MNTGWEVRPLGWVLLALLVGRGALLCHHQADTSSQRRSAHTLDSPSARELPPSFALAAPYSTSVSVLLPLMNEYGVCPHEDGWSEEGVHHAQLAYASYAALLAAFEVTSLLGRKTIGACGSSLQPVRAHRIKSEENCSRGPTVFTPFSLPVHIFYTIFTSCALF